MGGGDRHRASSQAAADGPAGRPDRTSRRGSPPHDDHRPAHDLGRACSAARSTLPEQPVPPRRRRGPSTPWTGEPGTAGTVDGRRRRQDGPAARRPVRVATAGTSSRSTSTQAVVAAINEGRSHVGGGARARRARRRRPRRRPPPGDDRRRPRRPASRTSSSSSCRSCSTTRSSPTTATWTPRSTSIAPGRPRRRDRHLRDDAARSATRATGTCRASRRRAASRRARTSSSPSRRSGCSPAPCSATSRRTRSSSAGSARRRRTGRRAFYASVLDAEVVAMSSRRGGRVQQARRHDVPRRQHRVRQRVRALRRTGSASTSRRSSRRRTASRTATSTSPGSASAATASRSTRTSSCRGRRSWSSSALSRRVNDGQVGRRDRGARATSSAASRTCRSSSSA